MTEITPVPLEQVNTHAEDTRRVAAAQLGAPVFTAGAVGLDVSTSGGAHGVVGFGDLKVASAGGRSITVAAGAAFILGSESTGQGAYLVGSLDGEALTHDAHQSFPRYDLVVIRVRDAEESGALNEGPVEIVKGAAASTPTVPAAPANSLVLAQVLVPAVSGALTITDTRTFAGAAGAVRRLLRTAQRPDVANVGEGTFFYDLQTHELLQTVTPTAGPRPPWNLPWGLLSSAAQVSDQTISGTGSSPQVVSGTTITLTPPQNRRIRVTYDGAVNAQTGTPDARLEIQVNGARQLPRYAKDGLNGPDSVHMEVIAVSTGGSLTFRVIGWVSATAGEEFVLMNDSIGGLIQVEDAGPAGAPV